MGRKPRPCVGAVAGNAAGEGIEAVVFQLIVQLVQQFYTDDFTVGSFGAKVGGPLQTMGFKKYPSAIGIVGVKGGPNPLHFYCWHPIRAPVCGHVPHGQKWRKAVPKAVRQWPSARHPEPRAPQS